MLQAAADNRAKGRVVLVSIWHAQLGFAGITDARSEAKAQQVHQSEDMIGEAGRAVVVFLDPQIGSVI